MPITHVDQVIAPDNEPDQLVEVGRSPGGWAVLRFVLVGA